MPIRLMLRCPRCEMEISWIYADKEPPDMLVPYHDCLSKSWYFLTPAFLTWEEMEKKE